MRTDRELLELAARANWAQDVANDEVSLRYCEINDGILYLHADNQDHNGHDREFVWNPLTEDGDALRLAVKLNLTTVFHPALGQALCRPYWSTDMGKESREDVEKHANDPYAATRRAIVRAAAEIGAHPKQHNDGGADGQD